VKVLNGAEKIRPQRQATKRHNGNKQGIRAIIIP
jgi:hypothetical protein